MEVNLKKLFSTIVSNNKVGHAYLIGNIDYNNIKKELNSIISDYIFNDEISVDNNPDVFFVSPEGLLITKNQIRNLQESIINTSQIHNKKVYIISECEKLNAYAANSLLKTLEEPREEIYAFLITENINKVISTIKSRCQVLFISSQTYSDFDENNKSVLDFIRLIEDKKEDSIVYYDSIIKKDIEKKDLKKFLISVEYFYRDCINRKFERDIEYFISEEFLLNEIAVKNSLKKLTNKLLIINNAINNVEYNLNTYLMIDKIIIDFGRC
jgi:DNA polymerase III delta prime subunit